MALSPGQTVDGLESGIKLNFPEQHAQLAQCLNALRQTGRYCDITVKVQDKSFSCHRAVLACRTPLFQCLGDDPIVRVDFLNPAAFSALLDYMYTSELTVSSSSYSDEDLLAAAQALRLRPVVEWLTDYLKAKGAVDQVLEQEGNLQNTAPSSLLMPSATVNLTSNTVSALFPRNPGLAFLNNAPYSPQTELQAASTSLGQNQPIESLFFKNMGKSNGVATVTTEDVSSPAPARWDPQLSTCHRCGVHFLSSKVLKQHLAVCGGGAGKEPSCMQNSIADPPRQRPVFGCSRCSQYFVSAKTLQMHLKVCSKLQEYKCSLCQLRFVSQRALDFHTRDCWKSIQEFESPQGSRSTNIRGNSNKKKPNEVGSFSRKGGNGEKNTARLQDTSKPQQQERSSDESVVEVENMEESGSQEVLMLNAKDIDISKLITSKQFCCSNCCDIFTTPHKLQIHKRKCIKSPGTSTVDQQQQQKCVCDRCALSFPSMKSLQRHMQSCKKSFLFVDVRNKTDKSTVSDKAAASSSREEQPVQEATVSEEATPSKQSAGTKSPSKTSGTVSSVTSEKKTKDPTAKPSEKDSKPVKESSGDDVEKSSKKDPSHTRRASSGGGSPALTMLRSSPRHMDRTLRSSPKKPHILSNLAKGNLRIKLIKKVHKTVTSQAAKCRRISAATSSSTTASSAGKANTTPKVAGEKRAAEDRSPSAAKRLSTGTGTMSTPCTAKEGPPNRSKTVKGSTTEHKNTAQVSGKQRQSSPAASRNAMPKPRPRVVLRRVDTAIGTPEGTNTISANIDTVIKLEPEDDSDQGEVSRSAQQPIGRNFGSPETSLFSAQYHCGNCGLSFGQRKAMQEHEFKCKQAFEEAYCQQLSKAAKSHCCQNCLKLFSSDSSLRAHREECQGSGAALYRCKICWEDTDQPKAHLEKHWRWNRPTELRNNPCLSIETDLPLIKSLYMSVVKPNEKWPCSLCENEKGSDRRRSVVMFKDRLRLWSHQASSHRVVWRNLTCPVCTGSFKFNQRIEYLRHMFANHVKLKKAEKTFHCQVCGKSFHDRGLLELHLFKHGRKTAK